MKKRIIFLLILNVLYLITGTAQSFSNITEQLESYSCSDNLKKISNGLRVKAETYNLYFVNNDNYFYGINDKKLDDGITGFRKDSIEFNSLDDNFEPIKVIQKNTFIINGLLDLNNNYYTLILTEKNFESKIVGLYNFSPDGKMLSSIRFFEYSLGENDEIKYEITKSTINDLCVIHQRTEADFIIDRKIQLKSDGHFKVIQEEVKDFDH